LLKFRGKGVDQFLPGNATNSSVLGLHTDVIQLVQITEYANLRELRDSRQKYEAQIAVGTFQHAVKGLQGLTVIFQQGIIAEGLQQGCRIHPPALPRRSPPVRKHGG